MLFFIVVRLRVKMHIIPPFLLPIDSFENSIAMPSYNL
jgi:hypothetical protein